MSALGDAIARWHVLNKTGGTRSPSRPAGSFAPPQPQAPPDPRLFEHLVKLCEDQEKQIAALRQELARVTATRDRYQASGKRALAQLRQLESILQFPGVMRELQKVLHPDSGVGGDVHARTEIFKMLMAVRGRLTGGR